MENQSTNQNRDSSVVDMQILRRDMYLLTSMLLADKEVVNAGNIIEWAQVFYESETTRLLLWVGVAVRNLLDLLEGSDVDAKTKKDLSNQHCGEYWADFKQVTKKEPPKEDPLTFRQACNSIVHAAEFVPYEVPKKELTEDIRYVYSNRVTVRSTKKGKITRAQLDVVRFVQVADELINVLERV